MTPLEELQVATRIDPVTGRSPVYPVSQPQVPAGVVTASTQPMPAVAQNVNQGVISSAVRDPLVNANITNTNVVADQVAQRSAQRAALPAQGPRQLANVSISNDGALAKTIYKPVPMQPAGAGPAAGVSTPASPGVPPTTGAPSAPSTSTGGTAPPQPPQSAGGAVSPQPPRSAGPVSKFAETAQRAAGVGAAALLKGNAYVQAVNGVSDQVAGMAGGRPRDAVDTADNMLRVTAGAATGSPYLPAKLIGMGAAAGLTALDYAGKTEAVKNWIRGVTGMPQKVAAAPASGATPAAGMPADERARLLGQIPGAGAPAQGSALTGSQVLAMMSPQEQLTVVNDFLRGNTAAARISAKNADGALSSAMMTRDDAMNAMRMLMQGQQPAAAAAPAPAVYGGAPGPVSAYGGAQPATSSSAPARQQRTQRNDPVTGPANDPVYPNTPPMPGVISAFGGGATPSGASGVQQAMTMELPGPVSGGAPQGNNVEIVRGMNRSSFDPTKAGSAPGSAAEVRTDIPTLTGRTPQETAAYLSQLTAQGHGDAAKLAAPMLTAADTADANFDAHGVDADSRIRQQEIATGGTVRSAEITAGATTTNAEIAAGQRGRQIAYVTNEDSMGNKTRVPVIVNPDGSMVPYTATGQAGPQADAAPAAGKQQVKRPVPAEQWNSLVQETAQKFYGGDTSAALKYLRQSGFGVQSASNK